MASETATAIILRLTEWSESSLVLTLFTREYGKLSALAKGARRPKAPFDFSLDMLSECHATLIRKPSESLDLLTESKLIHWFRLPRDLQRWYAGFYLAELLDAMTETDLPIPELFDLTSQTVRALSGGVWNDPTLQNETNGTSGLSARDGVPVSIVVTRWELMTLRLLGLFPDLDGCSECGEEIVERGRASFHFPDGFLCPRCCAAKRSRPAPDRGIRFAVSMASSTLQLMRNLLDVRLRLEDIAAMGQTSGSASGSASGPMTVPTELRIVVNQWIADQLGRIPRTAAFLPHVVGPLRRIRRFSSAMET